MNKRFIAVNLVGQLFICLLAGILLAGCSILSAGSKTSKNLETNENEGLMQNQKVSANSQETKPTSNQQKEILWDFRKTKESKTLEFSKAETKTVFTFLFGNKWDNNLSISSRVSGSFTKPNAKETLYYVSGCDEGDGFQSNENCAHATWGNAGRIAIYDGTTPVMKAEATLGSEIIEITDINGDGITEILGFFGFTGQGETATKATLGQIEDGKYKEIKSFDGSSDGCGTGIKSREIEKAAVISYVPTTNGNFPIFTEEYFQGKCDNPQWRKITKKQFEADPI